LGTVLVIASILRLAFVFTLDGEIGPRFGWIGNGLSTFARDGRYRPHQDQYW
jgi:hypothetical protein